MLLAPTLLLNAGSGAAIARPTFSRDFAGEETLNNGTGPAITFTRASNATFFDANGTLQTASNDAPRFDHSGGSSLGLLIEEARTNSIRNSQAGGAAVGAPGTLPTNWGTVGITGGADVSREIVATGTEAGMSYVDLRLYGTASASMFVGFDTTTGIVAADGQTWSGSVYVKLVAGSMANIGSVRVQVRANDVSGSTLQSGTTTFTPSASLARYSHTLVFNSASIARTRFGLAFFDAVGAIDLTLRIAAPQLELGAFPTSYIPTTTAAATRAADSAVVTPISSFYNQVEGTVVAHYSRSSVQAAGSQIPWMFSDNSGDNIACVTDGSSGTGDRALIVAGGASQMNTGSINYSANQQIARALGIKTDNCATSANGASVVTDSTVTLPSVDRLTIGFAPYFAASRLNGHIRKIAYWPKRLSNTLLEQLTT
jgi:hypothetical protein